MHFDKDCLPTIIVTILFYYFSYLCGWKTDAKLEYFEF